MAGELAKTNSCHDERPFLAVLIRSDKAYVARLTDPVSSESTKAGKWNIEGRGGSEESIYAHLGGLDQRLLHVFDGGNHLIRSAQRAGARGRGASAQGYGEESTLSRVLASKLAAGSPLHVIALPLPSRGFPE